MKGGIINIMDDIFEDLAVLLEQEEIGVFANIFRERKLYNARNRFNHRDMLNEWDDEEFFKRFRLSKGTVADVATLIEEEIKSPSEHNNPIPPLMKLLVCLRFYASNTFYPNIGDLSDIHKSTVAKIIKEVSSSLARLRNDFITFPETDDLRIETQRAFYDMASFPRVIGAIDCTHIRLQSPGGANGETFRNRKGHFSLNVQAVCDAEYYIQDVVARWPGSSHVAHIFDKSLVCMRFENNDFGSGILLGDSGYPLCGYFMTPLANPNGAAENLYNEAQIRLRNVIEKTFGIWKRRFPVLSSGLRCQVPLVQDIVVATAVLHNLARRNRANDMDENEEVDLGIIDDQPIVAANNEGRIVQNELIDHFRNLL